MYKDQLLIPSKALAEQMAEEWDKQPATMDIKQLHLNNMFAKATRSLNDHALVITMQDEAQSILENDNLCYVEPISILEDEFKSKLREAQLKQLKIIKAILSKEFGVNLRVFETILDQVQDKSVKKAKQVFDALDPIAMTCAYQVSQSTKSSAISLSLLHGKISVEEAV